MEQRSALRQLLWLATTLVAVVCATATGEMAAIPPVAASGPGRLLLESCPPGQQLVFTQRFSGQCTTPITSVALCNEAAQKLEVADVVASPIESVNVPPGCIFMNTRSLILNTGSVDPNIGAHRRRRACSGGINANPCLCADTCTPCMAGRSQPITSAQECTPCPSGKYQPNAGQTFCSECVAGKHRSVGSTCVDCAAGKYADAAAMASCLDCPSGMFQGATGQAACLACAGGATSGQTACIIANLECPAGQAGTSVCANCTRGRFKAGRNDKPCTNCPCGTFTTDLGATECGSSCPAGTYGDGSKGVCAACPRDHFCTDSEKQPFAKATVCIPGEFVIVEPSAVSDRMCATCGAGNFSETNAASCKRCPAGKFQDLPGRSYCEIKQLCVPGAFEANATDQSTKRCELCPVMHFSDTVNAARCERCPPGKFQDETGQPYCEAKQPCVPGKFEANATDTSSTRCESCAPGRISFSTNEPNCTECANGQFTSEVPRVICTPCPPGRFGSASGPAKDSALHCQPCAPGRFQPNQAQSKCQRCREDTVCPHSSTFEQACRGNEFVVKEEQACRACPRVGPGGEAECKSGRLVMKDGFFNNAVPRSGAVQGAGTAVNGQTVFAKCPCTKCCGVNNYTGATQCRLNTAGTLCAICQAGFHRQTSGSCVPCPQASVTEYLGAQASQFITIALLLLLAMVLSAMDARAEWRHFRWLQHRLQGLRQKFASKTKILVTFGQFVTLAGPVYAISWPPMFRNFLSSLPKFNLDVFGFVPMDCYLPTWSFHTSLVASTLGFVGLGLLAAAAQMAKGKTSCLDAIVHKADALAEVVLVIAYVEMTAV
jgi:hypothetical protein